MNIACTIDNNYIRHCAVMLRSLYEVNKQNDINVYIVHDQLDSLQRATLARYLGEFLSSISFIQINPDLLHGFPVHGHITIATYFRLLLPAVLPWAVDRVLFMDCDMIVVDSLRELWDMNLRGAPMAAVIDRSQKENRERIGLANSSYYFNAGVLLIDLQAWREQDVLSRGIRFAQTHADRLEFWDQDVLNHLFEGAWLPFEARWNALPHLWSLNRALKGSDAYLTPQDIIARDRPAIIHFAGPGVTKPWNYRCEHPWKQQYLKLQKHTPWASVALEEYPPPPPIQLMSKIIFKTKCIFKDALHSFRKKP